MGKCANFPASDAKERSVELQLGRPEGNSGQRNVPRESVDKKDEF